jgi:hypothetical protein
MVPLLSTMHFLQMSARCDISIGKLKFPAGK